MKDTFGVDDSVIPIFFPSSLIRWLEQEGYSRDDLIEGSGLVPSDIDNPEVLICFRQHRVLIGNALRLTANPHIGLYFGKYLPMTSMGTMGYAVLSSKNLSEAVDMMQRYMKVQAPLIGIRTHVDEDSAGIFMQESLDYGDIRQFMYESFLSSISRIYDQLIDAPKEGIVIHYGMDKPDDWQTHEHLLPFPVVFSSGRVGVTFPSSLLEINSKMWDPATASAMRRVCEEQLAKIQDNQGLTHQIQDIIQQAGDELPSMNVVAEKLCVSPRTLRRELEKLDTTYQSLLDEYRKDMALQYLKTSSLSVQEIALKLGYSDPSNFSRAFRKWTGKSPGDFRRAGQ